MGITKTLAYKSYVDEKVGYVTPQQYGAIADGVTDDSVAIQAAIDSGKTVFFPQGTYLIGSTISITNKSYWNLYAEDAKIVYTGTDYAISISASRSLNLYFGTIQANNGGCIAMISDADDKFVQYINLRFVQFKASTNCIYGYASAGWVNEIRISDGAFTGGDYGMHLKSELWDAMNHWNITNVGVEGVTTGFYLEGSDSAGIACHVYTGCRYAEAFTTLFKTAGRVKNIKFIGASLMLYRYLDLSEQTEMHILAPMTENGGEVVSCEAIVHAGVVMLQNTHRVNNYLGETGTLDWRDLDNPYAYYPSYIGIGSDITELYLPKHYGRVYGLNEFILKLDKESTGSFTLYDYDGNIIFNNVKSNAWSILRFEWFSNSLGWRITKLSNVTAIASE